MKIPTFAEEEALAAAGFRYIAGADEVGCGALAGPLMAAAVILPLPLKARWLDRVRDSKLLTPAQREKLAPRIRRAAVSFGIGQVSVEFIEHEGLTRARYHAIKSAIAQLSPAPDFILIDYLRLPDISLPQKGVPEGDTRCFSIACASIVAKVARDELMTRLDKSYPGYGLARHKGYGTREHLECLAKKGPCPIHRRTFQPVRDVLGQ